MRLPRPFRPPTVGLDIGSSSVRGVVLNRTRGGWTLTGIADAPVLPTMGRADAAPNPDVVADGIRQVCDELHARRGRLIAALPGSAAIVKRLSIPAMTDEELAEAIPWEAEQYVPFDLAEVHLDYQVLGAGSTDPRDGSEVFNVLLVAAKREGITDRTTLLAQAGREPSILDIEAFALANAYEVNYPERADPVALLVHVGRVSTVVCLLDRGQPAFTRDIAFGGQHYSEALMRDLNVDAVTAERIKHGHLPPHVDADHVSAVLRDTTAQLVLEIRKSVDFFRATAPIERLSRIMLSGGAWRADGLADLLGSEFDTAVEILDPFRRIARPKRADARDTPGPEFAIAVGLALREEVA